MNKRSLLPYILFFSLFSSSLLLFGEGTKQVRPTGASEGRLSIDNSYTPFATFGCPSNYRLNIHISNVGETILFGLKSPAGITYNLKDPNGNVVLTGTCPNNALQLGYISSYAMACAGPFTVNGGYSPIIYQTTSPSEIGDFYIEFSGYADFDFWDFQVVTGANSPALPGDTINGRVWSASWQFYAALSASMPPFYEPFSGKFYVYSDDGIVTSCRYKTAHVGRFTMFCNPFGVTNTNNFQTDRKSVTYNTSQSWPGIAQYKVFLNNPDTLAYPSGAFGMMIGSPTMVPDPNFPACSGQKLITVNVNKAGYVEIFIDVPYGDDTYDVSLYEDVVMGTNTIPWDGKDNLGNPVPDGTTITLTVNYVNGLTNLPLWDIEQNPQGFFIELVRPINPSLSSPLTYWDDSNVSGGSCPTGINLAGCNSDITGCHTWGGSDCHNIMVNTWWYSASSSTATLDIYYTGTPPDPVPYNQIHCGPGVDTAWVHILPSESAWWYDAPVGGNLIQQPDTMLITPFLSSSITYYVEAHNDSSGCISYNRIPVTVTIIPAGDVIFTPPASSVCRGQQTSIGLSSSVSPATFTWTATGSSGFVTGYGPGAGNAIQQFLYNNGPNIETVTYSVHVTANGCTNPNPFTTVVTVYPKPKISTAPMSKAICSGNNTNISLTSNVTGTTFTWNSSVTGGVVTGNTNGGGNLINDVLVNSLGTPGTVQYVIHMTANGCPGNDTIYTVTVNPRPVPVITGNNLACLNVAGNTFTTTAGMSGYTWTVAPDGTITSGAGTNTIQVTWNTTGAKTITLNYTNTYGCNATTPSTFNVTVNPLPVPTLSGNTGACAGSTGNIYTTEAGKTQYQWSVSAGGVITAGGNNTSNTATITWNTPGAQTVSINYHDANGCTAVSPTVYNVTVFPRPVPVIAGPAAVCAGSTGNVYSTAAGMTGYTWTVPSGGTVTAGGTATDNTITITWNTAGARTVTVNYTDANSCNAVTPTVYNVTVNPLPVPAIAGPAAVCAGITGSVYSTLAGMTNYTWNISAGGTATAGGGTGNNTVTVTWNTPGPQTVSVNYNDLNGCTAVSPTVYNVTVNPLPVPVIAGNNFVCAGTTGVVYTAQAGMSNYIWNVSAGGTITAGGGAGNNTVTVTWNTPGSRTVSVNYTDANGCTATAPTVFNVTVNPLPVPVIAGNNNLCAGTTGVVYSTQTGMTNYTWNVSAGGTVTAGGTATDNSVTVTWNTAGAQSVSVNFTDPNSCTAVNPVVFPVTVHPLPVPSITGSAAVCAGTTGVVYSTQAGMTNYIWSVSAGGTITSGGGPGNNTVTVTWNTPGAQTVSVNYNDANTCTAVNPTVYNVTVHPLPVPSLTGASAVCLNSTTNYQTDPGMTGYTWTVTAGGIITSGTGTNSININWISNGVKTITVNYIDPNGCTAATATTFNVTVSTLPVPGLNGLASICTGFSTTYTSDPGMTNYSWIVSGGGSVTAGGGTSDNTVTVLWTGVGPQTVSVNYYAGTGCTAPSPTVLNVTVNPLPVPTITGTSVLCAGTTGVVYSTQAGMSNYLWNVSAGGTVTAGGGIANNTVTVTWNTPGAQNVSINYTDPNGCTALAPVNHPVTVNPLPVPTITGTASVCQNSTHTYTTEAGQFNYNWIVSAGGTITAGGGTNSITVLWTTTGPQTITINYNDANGCTAPTPTIFNITVNVLPVPALAGVTAICTGFSATYTTDAGMSNYSWIVSAGGTITAGGGINDNTVTVLWNTVGPQSVSVNYFLATGCTAGAPTVLNVTVNALPAPTIAGSAVVCEGTAGVVYTTQAGNTNYLWNISAGGTVTAGGGVNNNTVTVTWVVPGAQTVAVNYTNPNGCTALSPTIFPVTVNPLPVPTISGPASVCLNSTTTYFTESGEFNYSWTVSAGGTITSGTGTSSISVLWSTSGPKTITVNYFDANGCTSVNPVSYAVNVNTLPVPALNGLNNICVNDVAVYSTDPGMTNYAWTISAGGTITAGGTSTDATVTVLWTTVGNQTVSVNYFAGTGCTAPTPTVLNVFVKPRPVVNNAGNSAVCSGTSISIPITANLPGTTFTWTATPSSPSITGATPGNGNTITDVLVNTGSTIGTVTYAVTPSLNGCDGAIANFIVTVYPVANVIFTPNGQQFCAGGTTNIKLSSNVAGTTYSWTATGSSANITGFGPGNDTVIAQTLNSTGYNVEWVRYIVTPVANNCTGTKDTVIVTVNPKPVVTFTMCMDPTTTTAAKPITLKGGIPLGGIYSGTGVSAGIFYPSLAGPGMHTITYTYTNSYTCTDNFALAINVVNPLPFFCNSMLTDVRDNKQYPTVQIGGQCWMAAGLNYGNLVASSAMQRDNCIPEKYCFSDNPGNCAPYGALYQWDEIMQYNNAAAAAQGLCPPGWHVPTEAEWGILFNYYISNGFAGAPLKYTGYSGFNALLDGTRFLNQTWSFSGFATMIWSSTSHGPYKAWAHGMNTYNPSVSYYPAYRHNAFTVRCLKD